MTRRKMISCKRCGSMHERITTAEMIERMRDARARTVDPIGPEPVLMSVADDIRREYSVRAQLSSHRQQLREELAYLASLLGGECRSCSARDQDAVPFIDDHELLSPMERTFCKCDACQLFNEARRRGRIGKAG